MNRERTRRNVTLALVIALPMFVAAFEGRCDKKPRQTDPAVDGMITTKVRENLTASTQVRAIDIGINTFNLKVTLDGTVATEAERAEAVRIAGQTEIEKDGVKFKVKEVDAGKLKIKPR